MRIRITHDTVYRYQQPVRSLIQALRLMPRGHDGQHVLDWSIEPSIDGAMRAREDGFGNIVHLFSATGSIESFSLRVSGVVDTQDTAGVVRGAVERVPDFYYLRASDLTEADQKIRDFATDVAGDLTDPLGGLHRLLGGLNREVAFDTRPTDVRTTAAQAFALGRGVCQDITHIFIAACRHLGLPARYVSGYLRRADGIVAQEAGHAWAEAKVPNLGWVGFDVTNGICVGEGHVRIAIGLDYLGAAPVRGSRTGGGAEELAVTLRVEDARLTGQSQRQDGQGQSQRQG